MDNDITALSIDEIDTLLRSDAVRLSVAERNVTTARETYASRVERHEFRGVPEVDAALDAQYGVPMRQAEKAANDLAVAIAEQTRKITAATAKPGQSLSAGEMVAAGGYAPLAQADAEHLPLGQFVERVRGAVLSGDRAMMAAYAAFAGKRTAPAAIEIGVSRSDPDADVKRDLRNLLDAISAKLADPRFSPIHDRAKALSIRASDIRHDSGQRARAAERAKTPYAFQTAGDVSRWGD